MWWIFHDLLLILDSSCHAMWHSKPLWATTFLFPNRWIYSFVLFVWMNCNICKCAYIDSVFLFTSCFPWICKQRMSDETWWSICIEQKAEWLGQWGRIERVKKKSRQRIYNSGFCFQDEKTKVNWLRLCHWNHRCLQDPQEPAFIGTTKEHSPLK